MFPAWIEAVVPLGIIAGMIATMGASQGGIHKLVYGKPKLVGADHWDRLVDQRDEHVKADQ